MLYCNTVTVAATRRAGVGQGMQAGAGRGHRAGGQAAAARGASSRGWGAQRA